MHPMIDAQALLPVRVMQDQRETLGARWRVGPGQGRRNVVAATVIGTGGVVLLEKCVVLGTRRGQGEHVLRLDVRLQTQRQRAPDQSTAYPLLSCPSCHAHFLYKDLNFVSPLDRKS